MTHSTSISWQQVEQESLALFRDLLRLDTTNPPGHEHLATDLLASSLREDNIEPWIVESAPGRANLVARLPKNTAPAPGQPSGPLMLAGHTDVVPADAAAWRHPPFEAVIADEMVWGRGALDMKNMVAMSAMTIKLLARHPELPRTRDVIFAAVADEEEGCALGSSWLVDHHPDRVRAETMIGEVGGFWLNLSGHTFMPIMVAEKGRAHLRLRAQGPPGHGSIPHDQSALLRLSVALTRLSNHPLPHHITPVVAQFIRALASALPLPRRAALLGLLDPRVAPLLLDHVLPDRDQARAFNAMLRNTAVPTILRAGDKLNLIPASATCELDGRLLPGQTASDLVRELEVALNDPQISIELLSSSPPVCVDPIESDVMRAIRHVVAQHEPHITCVPYMITGFTDARAFSRLGTRCYGFSPLKLDPRHNLSFSALFHGVDERVPVEGFLWGQRVLFDVVARLLA